MKRSIVKSFVWLFLSCAFVGNNYALKKVPHVGRFNKNKEEVKPVKQESIEKKPVVVSMLKKQQMKQKLEINGSKKTSEEVKPAKQKSKAMQSVVLSKSQKQQMKQKFEINDFKKTQEEVKPAKLESKEMKFDVESQLRKQQPEKVSMERLSVLAKEIFEGNERNEVDEENQIAYIAKVEEFLNEVIQALPWLKKKVQKIWNILLDDEKIFAVKLCRCCKVGIDFMRNSSDVECPEKLKGQLNQIGKEVVELLNCVEDGVFGISSSGVDLDDDIRLKQLLQDLSVQGILGKLDRIEKSRAEYSGSDYMMDHVAECFYVLLMCCYGNETVQQKAQEVLNVIDGSDE